MKKNTLLLMAAMALLMHSCQKPNTIPSNYSYPYHLNNVQDVLINHGVATDFVMTLSLTDSLDDGTTFTVTPTGVPAGITCFPASIDVSNTDSFKFYFSATDETAGTHPITFNCTARNRYLSSYPCNITAQANCTYIVTGDWNVYDSGSITLFPSNYTTQIVPLYDSNKVQFVLPGRVITCSLDCGKGTLVSDPSDGVAYSISGGAGTFGTSKLVVRYVQYSNPIIYVCTTLTR